MVDDHDISRRFGGLELEADLLLDGGVQIRWCVGAVGRRGVILAPMPWNCESSGVQFRVKSYFPVSPVWLIDRLVEHGALHQAGKVGHSCIANA